MDDAHPAFVRTLVCRLSTRLYTVLPTAVLCLKFFQSTSIICFNLLPWNGCCVVYRVICKTSDQVSKQIYPARAVDGLPCHVDELWLPFNLGVV